MNDVDTLAAVLQTVLSEARESLGLPEIELSSPEAMLAEAARISELVSSRMRNIEEQLGNLDATRSAAHGYLAGEATLAGR
jgi:hypothetical protein